MGVDPNILFRTATICLRSPATSALVDAAPRFLQPSSPLPRLWSARACFTASTADDAKFTSAIYRLGDSLPDTTRLMLGARTVPRRALRRQRRLPARVTEPAPRGRFSFRRAGVRGLSVIAASALAIPIWHLATRRMHGLNSRTAGARPVAAAAARRRAALPVMPTSRCSRATRAPRRRRAGSPAPAVPRGGRRRTRPRPQFTAVAEAVLHSAAASTSSSRAAEPGGYAPRHARGAHRRLLPR